MQWEQKLARQSTREDPCESVLIRVPIFLCALSASAVKNPFQAAKDFHVSSTDIQLRPACIGLQPDGSLGFSANCGLRTADFLGRGLGSFLCQQLLRIKPFPVPPQPLQIIVSPCLPGKNVNYQIDVVHEDPLGIAVAFDVGRPQSVRAQLLLYIVRYGLDLPGRVSRAEEEVVGEGGYPGNIQHDQVRCFFVIYSLEGDL